MRGEGQRLMSPISAHIRAGDPVEEREMLLSHGLQLDETHDQTTLGEPASSPLNTLSQQKGEPKSRNKCPLKCPPF